MIDPSILSPEQEQQLIEAEDAEQRRIEMTFFAAMTQAHKEVEAEAKDCPLTFSPEGRDLLAALFDPTLDEQAAVLDSTPGTGLGDRWE